MFLVKKYIYIKLQHERILVGNVKKKLQMDYDVFLFK